jgi:NADH:ubiquinone oxidoreductase subunit F (NADH-binding)
MTLDTPLIDPPRLATRLLSGASADLATHRARAPRPPAPGRSPHHRLIGLVERSGLGGRGGAAFPTGRKLRAVAARPGPRVVVVNAAEGEPASAKDRMLLLQAPHLVLDGALLAATAVGAERVVVCVDRARTDAVDAMRRALAERADEPAGVAVQLAAPPSRYVAGVSSSLVQWLDGGPAVPTLSSAHERGVGGRPTLVLNTETVAHLAQIAWHGAEWFRSLGTEDDPGTALVTVSGAVAQPAVVEVAYGTPLAEVVGRAGGSTAPVQALLVGGFFGTWVAARPGLAAPWSRAGLGPLGASPGAGVVIALPVDACGLVETALVLRWFAGEGAGQCGPCVYGLPDLATTTAALARGEADAGAVARLRRWADQIEGRGACHHPDGAVGLLRSALTVFEADVARHAAGVPCTGAAGRPVLRVPTPGDGWR